MKPNDIDIETMTAEAVLHDGGEPTPPPVQGQSPRGNFVDPDTRRAAAIAELERIDSPDGVEPSEGGGDVADQGVGPDAEPVEGSEGAGGADRPAIGIEERLAEMERKHAAEMAVLRDRHERALEAVARITKQRDAPPQIPNPDEDPGGYVNAIVEPVKRDLAEMRQLEIVREQNRRLEMVGAHLDKEMGAIDVFKGRPNFSSDVRAGIIRELFADQSVTLENWQGKASERLKAAEARFAGEFARPQLQRQSQDEAKAKQHLANKVIPKGQRGAGSGSPPPSGFKVPEKFNFADPEQRRRAALAHLQAIE